MVKVLAIDDSPTMHRLFKMVFTEEHGFSLKTAYNGEEGLELLQSFQPDIILLDFIMPKMNGFHFAKVIRNEYNSDVPILLITSKGEDIGSKFQEKFTNIDFITKPFDANQLVEKIELMLESPVEKKKPQKTTSKSAEIHENVMERIIEKVEAGVLPVLRKLIEKILQFETGYMISDVKGESITLDDFKRIIEQFEGKLTFFNNENNIHFYIQQGSIIHGWIGDNPLSDIFELFQDISNTCLMEVESLQELYTQLREIGYENSFLQKYYEFYLLNILEKVLQGNYRYFLDEVNIPETYQSKFKYDVGNIISSYSSYEDEKSEINKILYDDSLRPAPVEADLSSLSRFEQKIYELCDGEKNIGKITSYFGNNNQIAKNTIGALILTGYLTL